MIATQAIMGEKLNSLEIVLKYTLCIEEKKSPIIIAGSSVVYSSGDSLHFAISPKVQVKPNNVLRQTMLI